MKNTQWLQDEQAVQDYLFAFDMFPTAPEEGIHYIKYALKRWTITLEMIPPTPPEGGKLLELGSSPFLMTLLISKCFNYQLHGVNFTNDNTQPRGRYTFTAKSESLGEQYDFPYDYFNMEIEHFPYPDDEFDVVLLCEVIEHLTLDPTFVLAEAHRVLKPGGQIIVTTPNLVRWENFLALIMGRSISDAYSGYGASGRHNREYAPLELWQLMAACGYKDVQIKILDQHDHKGLGRLAKVFRKHWRDNLFAVGKAEGRPRYAYPDWLYRSLHACHKVVSPLLVVGENDAVQMGTGWHLREKVADFYARWSKQEAIAYLKWFPEARQVTIQVCGLAGTLGRVALTIQIGNQDQSFTLTDDDWHELVVKLPSDFSPEKSIAVTFKVDRVRVPAQINHPTDRRELGVLVRQLELR